MAIRRRVVPLALAGVLLGGGAATAVAASSGGGETSTSATSTAVTAAKSDVNTKLKADCLGNGNKKWYTATPRNGDRPSFWPGQNRWAYTTANCADINVNVSAGTDVRVCFKATKKCNKWKYAPAGRWVEAATGVADGSGFYVQFRDVYQSKGWIAY
ncbi:hypothetical protein HUT18_15840 [Streptomyces sp. NA04227]|uniref:hypothetical protein n=1 Tax=Streptomyces sp. NA04227 TaxID=2742136 RepID=UPI0015927675|nr:hypothetical protein [Streptomyces sp. NA04227]QKW07632.1 hypothetical protein HUT18_15840 [Streptomyces sp. NA04227]